MNHNTTVRRGSTPSAWLVVILSFVVMAIGLGSGRIEVLSVGALLFVGFFAIFRSGEAAGYAALFLLFLAFLGAY